MAEEFEATPAPEIKEDRPTMEEILAVADNYLRLTQGNGYNFRMTLYYLNTGDMEDLQRAKWALTSELVGWSREDIQKLMDKLKSHREEFDDK